METHADGVGLENVETTGNSSAGRGWGLSGLLDSRSDGNNGVDETSNDLLEPMGFAEPREITLILFNNSGD